MNDAINNISQDLFDKVIKNGYEGLVFRNKNSYYLANNIHTSSKLRSKDVLKYKKKQTKEFEVIGFTNGKQG